MVTLETGKLVRVARPDGETIAGLAVLLVLLGIAGTVLHLIFHEPAFTWPVLAAGMVASFTAYKVQDGRRKRR